MSEYQYYEFQAVEQQLTREQMSQLRELSTRATITSNSFTNTYNFGDFRGNPRKLMESYFDAHVYVSNFGTDTFLLRLARGVLAEEILTQYAVDDGFNWWTTKEHTILEWRRDDEPPDEWVEGEGWMAQLLPIRDELIRGDYRSLYIGWLSSIAGYAPEQEEEGEDDNDADDREPPVPPGLGSLTGAQTALAEFLGVDRDLIAAAAEASPDITAQGLSDPMVDTWVEQLPEQEIRAILTRVIRGEGLRVQTELQSRYYRSCRESTSDSPAGSETERRTVGELLAKAAVITRERERHEFQERERERHAYLEGLVPRFTELWATVDRLAEEQSGSSYDKACSLLVDLRDAYTHAGRRSDFDEPLARFLEQNSRRSSLVRRLKAARLAP